MGKDNKDKTESPFEEEGLLDDKCEACCGRCCYAPPPFRVALVPTIFLLAVFVVLWALLFWDVTTLCKNDTNKPAACVPTNVTDPITNVTRLTTCPAVDHECYYLTVTNISVAYWALFLWVIIAGYAIIRAIISIIWWIFRALSGKHGVMWAFLKPIDIYIHLLIWDAFFFVCYNRFLFSATPLVYTVCRAISVIICIVSIIAILASVIATGVTRALSSNARERAAKFRLKARLVDKLFSEKSLVNALTFGLSRIATKSAKNTKKVAKKTVDQGGDDVAIEMEPTAEARISDKELQAAWKKIDAAGKGSVTSDDVSKAAGVKGIDARDLWAVFSPEKNGAIFYSEFVNGIREVERGLRETVTELESRQFVGGIIKTVIIVILWTLGWSLAMESIELNIATLITAISLLTVALTMALSGLFGRMLNAFVFLLVSHPYYKGDIAVLGGEVTFVKKITLLNTYGYTTDGKWVMYDNAGIAGSRILNLTRSNDCVFVYENAVHVDTPVKIINTWERTIRAYIKENPEHWRDFSFTVSNLSGGNQLSIEMKAFARGANWGHSEVYAPLRAKLWILVHQSAIQLGIYAAPKSPETELVKIVDADEKDAGKKEKADADEDSSVEEKKKEKESKKKEKESKKGK